MKILVIEDDTTLSHFILKGLSDAGFNAVPAMDGEEGLSLLLSDKFDLIILDLMLPKMNGLQVLHELQTRGIDCPSIILSAKHSVEDRVEGLQKGAEDYLVKPFSFNELLARIQVLLRRVQRSTKDTVLEFNGLTINMETREVTRDGTRIELHPREFVLLHFLMLNKNQIVGKNQILERAWGYKFDPQTNVVDVLVCRLRNKIDKGFDSKLIHTIRGMGYALKKA